MYTLTNDKISKNGFTVNVGFLSNKIYDLCLDHPCFTHDSKTIPTEIVAMIEYCLDQMVPDKHELVKDFEVINFDGKGFKSYLVKEIKNRVEKLIDSNSHMMQ